MSFSCCLAKRVILAPWYENGYLTVFLYPISVWGCRKAHCKGETLPSLCVRETELYFHTHVAEKAAFSITCCFGSSSRSCMRRAAASSTSVSVERDSSLSLLPCSGTWLAELVLMCERMAEMWSVRVNGKPQLVHRMYIPIYAIEAVQGWRGGLVLNDSMAGGPDTVSS